MLYSLIFLSGILIGITGIFFGIGGGMLVTPVLTGIFNMPVHSAVATSMFVVFFTAVITSIKHIKGKRTNVRLGFTLASSAALGGVIGSFISVSINAGYIFIVLGIFQLIAAFFMIFNSKVPPLRRGRVYFSSQHIDCGVAYSYDVYNLPLLYIIIFFNSILSGMVGVGGAIIMVPIISFLGGVPLKVATATGAFIMIFTSLFGSIGYTINGLIDYRSVLLIIPAIYLGSIIASKFYDRVPTDKLYKFFAFFIITIAIRMLYKGLTIMYNFI